VTHRHYARVDVSTGTSHHYIQGPYEECNEEHMAFKIDGKFVSKEKYEAHMQEQAITELAGGEAPVSETDTTEPKKARNYNPVTVATAAVRKAKKELEATEAFLAKHDTLPSLDDAKKAYADAVAELHKVLGH
jgi:hypothetical protein